ncbi:ribonuclease H-like protein [Ramaria rubella]|nr:ribonuclease H-like protein [Ramaria rubella]
MSRSPPFLRNPRIPPSLLSGSRHSASHNYSTVSDSSPTFFLPQLASTNSRINHGSQPAVTRASSGNHHHHRRRSKLPDKSRPYHLEARDQSRPSPNHMSSRLSAAGGVLVYLRDAVHTDGIVSEYRDKFKGPLGFDIEYRPNFLKGQPSNKTALVQLAAESVTLLAQVSAMSGKSFPDTIRNIIQDPTIIKAGVGIQGDADKLWRDFGIKPASCLELGYLARAVDQQWASSKGLISLARLVKAYEGRVMKKPKHIQMSNWESVLTQDQQDCEPIIIRLLLLFRLSYCRCR